MGPTTTSGTYTYRLVNETVRNSYAYAVALQAIGLAYASIKADTTGFSNAINSGSDAINSVVNSASKYSDTVFDNTAMMKTYGSLITTILYALYGVTLGLSILALLGDVFILLWKRPGFRYFLHVAWCFMSLLMILGFLLALILYPISSILLDTCLTVKKVITEPAQFNTTMGLLGKSVAS